MFKSKITALLIAVSSITAYGQKVYTVMPLGDSITSGYEQTGISGGYRDPLYTLMATAGISFQFVGAASDNSTNKLTSANDQNHNGYGSWHIQDLTANFDASVPSIANGASNYGGYFLTGVGSRPALCPDFALLHIGANDVIQGTPNMNQNLLALVTKFHSYCGNSHILVASIIGMSSSGFTPAITPYNAYIKNTLAPSLPYLTYVAMNEAFSNSDGTDNTSLQGADGIHPNGVTGYPLMATVWSRVLIPQIQSTAAPTGGSGGTATCPPVITNVLTVQNGSGSGSYVVGASVPVIANTAPSGQSFVGWTGASVSSASSANTTLTMPSSPVTVAANYSVTPPVTTPPVTTPPVTTPPSSATATVSTQFPQYYNHGVVEPLKTAASNHMAGVVPLMNWNVVSTDTGTGPVTSAFLLDATGATSPIRATYSGYTINDGTNVSNFPAPIYYTATGLADKYLAEGSSFNQTGAQESLTITGLTANHTYSVVVYVSSPWWSNGSVNSAKLSLANQILYVKTSNALSGWVRSTATMAPGTSGNYVTFTGVTGSTTATILIDGNTVGLGGFQLVDTTGSTTTTSSTAPTPSATVPTGYHLTFDDEFSSLSTISDNNGGTAKWHTNAEQCCLGSTNLPTAMVGVSDGSGTFSLVNGGGLDIRLQNKNNAWTSGVLTTVDQNGVGFSQQYGYFEMSAQFSAGVGTWPAFWLLNTAAKTTAGVDAGEIDILEAYMQFPYIINTTLHNWSSSFLAANNGSSSEYYKQYTSPTNLSNGYHTYGMLWTAATMTFYVDGVTAYTTPTPANMNQPYYPIVDLGLGGGWPTTSTPAVNDMLVKYVRVYAAT